MVLDNELLETLLNVTALGLIALFIVAVVFSGTLIMRDRKASREAQLKMHADEQETLRQRDADTREREKNFFASIERIEKLAGAVERHVDTSLITEQQAKERDEDVIRVLQAVTSTLEGLHNNQKNMLTEQVNLKHVQGVISSAVARDVDIALETLTEVKRGGKKVEQVLDILRHIQEKLQQEPISNHDIMIDEDAPKNDDTVTPALEEEKDEAV